MNAFGEGVRSSHRRRIAVPAAIVGGALALGSAAWACTPSVRDEQTRFASCTPPAGATKPCKATLSSEQPFPNATFIKGPAGSRLTAYTETGDNPGVAYDLVFVSSVQLNQGIACYHAPTRIGGPVTAESDGGRPLTTGTIPSNAPLGRGEVCFSDSASRAANNYVASTSSIPGSFKVIV